jgi:O-antigen/teichoic acid export membrane protein
VTATALPVLTRARLHVVLSLGARALEAGAKFGLYALAARALGGHDAGRFFLALSIVHIVSTVARLGLERPLTRHVAAELAVGDGAAARRAALTGLAAILAASGVAGVLLFVTAPLIAGRVLHQPDMDPVLMLAALIVPVQNLAYALAYVLIGLERGATAQMVMNALAPVLSLTALMLGADDLTRLLAAYAAAFGVCGLLGLTCVAMERKRLTTPTGFAPPDGALPSLWHGARPLLVVEVSQASLLSLPVLILGALADPVSVSIFSIASRLSMLVTTVVLSLGALSAPIFARHYRLADWTALKAAVAHNRKLTLGFCLPLIAVMAAGAGPVLNLLDVETGRGVPVLLILLCGQLVFCLLPSRDVLLAMAGEGGILRRLSLWQLACCTALCFAAIPVWGAVGAALASATIWIGGAVALAVTARRRLPQV